MEENYKQHKIRMIKSSALSWDIAFVFILTVALYMLFQLQYINLAGFECTIPYFDPYSPDGDIDSWKDVVETYCESNFIAKLGGYILLGYLLLAAFSIASPLRATPVQYLTNKFFSSSVYGKYYTDASGKAPVFPQAVLLMIVSRHFFPLYLLYLYFVQHDFRTTLYHGGAIWACIALINGLKLYEHFSASKLTWDERFSGLRVNLTDSSLDNIEKEAGKSRKWYQRLFFKMEMFWERTQIGEIIIFVLLGFLVFNFLRDVNPPADYNEIVYKRPAPAWEDNAYFALAGLDAPEAVSDSYEYGRQRIIFHAARWAEYLKKIPVPYIHDVPEVEYNLFEPYKPVEELEFDKGGIENWECLYKLDVRENTSFCPAIQDVMALREKNSILWQRFQRLADFGAFSIPDHFIDATFSIQTLIDLSQLHAVYLVNLQSQGQTKKALREWMKYTRLYNNMVNTHSNMVTKALFMIASNTHAGVLEILLYNDPQIALNYQDEIEDAINIKNISLFRAGQLIVDEWRILEPMFLPTMGMSPNQKRKLQVCFKENEERAALSGEVFLQHQRPRICATEFPEDTNELMLRALTDKGNVISNLIHYLLMGGVLKGEVFIDNMHRRIADFKMATVAMQLIRDDVKPKDVQSYVNALPEEYWNPITGQPFLWNEHKGWLYYSNMEDPKLEPNRVLRVKLE